MIIYAIQVFKSTSSNLIYQTFRNSFFSAKQVKQDLKKVFINEYVKIETYIVED